MTAEVKLWGRVVAAVTQEPGRPYATFQYAPDFAESNFQISPVMMPLRKAAYEFPALVYRTFHGLPGLLSDSLPDKFGNALIDAWLAREQRKPESFSSVERLCTIGRRGIGALEFAPVTGPRFSTSTKIEIDTLVQLASEVLANRSQLSATFAPEHRTEALVDILRVGTSAGGARAKAVIAWNRETNEVRSGQVAAGDGFDYWLLKFDGVKGNADKELDDPSGFGAIEYAYSLMTKAAGITMTECRLLEENGRRHFMTNRFDRREGGEKVHMQSLCAIAHYDFNQAGAYSYEQALMVMDRLELSQSEKTEQFRRMVFNVVSRNQDDHVKNIAFLMDKEGIWSLSPAFDMTYSYNPAGDWTSRHQMSINGKRDGFTLEDFEKCGRVAGMSKKEVSQVLEEVIDAVRRWSSFAEVAQVAPIWQNQIAQHHRLEIPSL
jgi:serine/threonine-protein kinase HipA